MNVELGLFLDHLGADDYFWISVTTSEKNIYFGYAHQLPEEYLHLIVQNVYLDFASGALGISVI